MHIFTFLDFLCTVYVLDVVETMPYRCRTMYSIFYNLFENFIRVLYCATLNASLAINIDVFPTTSTQIGLFSKLTKNVLFAYSIIYHTFRFSSVEIGREKIICRRTTRVRQGCTIVSHRVSSSNLAKVFALGSVQNHPRDASLNVSKHCPYILTCHSGILRGFLSSS